LWYAVQCCRCRFRFIGLGTSFPATGVAAEDGKTAVSRGFSSGETPGDQYIPLPAVKLSTSVGCYAFVRKFAFYDGNRPDLRVDDVPFLKVSLEVGW